MPKLDETRPFIPVRIAVLTVSDTRALADDKSGATLAEMIQEAGHELADRAIVKDDVGADPGQGAGLDRRSRRSTSSSPPAAPASPAAT